MCFYGNPWKNSFIWFYYYRSPILFIKQVWLKLQINKFYRCMIFRFNHWRKLSAAWIEYKDKNIAALKFKYNVNYWRKILFSFFLLTEQANFPRWKIVCLCKKKKKAYWNAFTIFFPNFYRRSRKSYGEKKKKVVFLIKLKIMLLRVQHGT